MTEQTPKTPGQIANDVMAEMSARVAAIDIRDGSFNDAVVAAVCEHEAIVKLRKDDHSFNEAVGVGYVWYSADEAAWHAEREKTLRGLVQNSVSDVCAELLTQGVLFDISRPNIDQVSRTDAVAMCAGRLRVRGATKVIVFLQSAASVTIVKGKSLPVRLSDEEVFCGIQAIEYKFQDPEADSPNGAVVCSITHSGDTWMQADVDEGHREARMRRVFQATLAVVVDNLHRRAIIAQGTVNDEESNS